jgi:hypothetical protein
MPGASCSTAAIVVSAGLLVCVGACGGERGAGASTVSEHDSAGIRIVENHADTAALRAGWAIGPAPTLTIGGPDAPEALQLYQVAGARRLADGRIAVLNGGSAQLRIHGADGALLAVHGRKGEGPGEFTQPHLAGLIGDSLIVFDAGLRRATIMRPDSGYVRSYDVGTEGGGFPIARGVMNDGGLAIGGGMYFSSDQGFPNGLVRANSRYLIMKPDGTLRGDLGELPAAEMWAQRTGNSFSASAVPFGRVTGYTPAGDRVWTGTGDGWELRAWTGEGELERIVRFDRAQIPLTTALKNAAAEEQVADAANENEARATRVRLASIPTPSHVPPYELFLADAAGNAWIGEYLLPGETTRTWTIIDPAGRAIGRLTTPPRTLPLDIGSDWLLALTRDDLDLERVTLWTLQRPAPRP